MRHTVTAHEWGEWEAPFWYRGTENTYYCTVTLTVALLPWRKHNHTSYVSSDVGIHCSHNLPFSQNKDINTTLIVQEPQWTVVDSWCWCCIDCSRVLNDFFGSQRCTVKHPKASKQCRCQARRQEGVIWNVLGVWGPLGEEAQRCCYSFKLRTKTLTLASSGVTAVVVHWVGGSAVTYNVAVLRTNKAITFPEGSVVKTLSSVNVM